MSDECKGTGRSGEPSSSATGPSDELVCGRFAPSPTGALHLGHAQTMLLAWLQVRAVGGRFVLRMEDLDAARSRPGAAEAILRDLEWLGFDWDAGPRTDRPDPDYVQSCRHDLYEACIERLSDRLYACSCSRKDVREAAGAPHGGEIAYPGTCRDGPKRAGAPVSLRICVPEERVCWHDLWAGDCEQVPARVCGDFIVRAKGGAHVYQLACVADDIDMGVTHVLRGADLLSSTGRQILLHRWLGVEPPRFAHAPLRRDADGQRLAKRRGSPTLGALREAGEDPRAVLAELAQDLGIIDEGGRCQPADLVESFAARFPHLR